MSIKALSLDFAVAGQVAPEDMPAIAHAGFKSIVCNRPDREASDQPDFSRVEQAARDAGLQARYLPATSGQVTADHGKALAKLLDELPAPVLAYCRSGARSSSMWQLAQSLRAR